MNRKRARSVLLCLLLGVMVAAVLSGFTESDDFYCYELTEDGSAVIVGYTGYDHTVTIPETVDGHPIVSIANTAFYGSRTLQRLIITAKLRSVEKDAFAYCPMLRTVQFRGSCEIIGESAFEGCELLKTVELPEDLRLIDEAAFRNCIRLRRLYIPASVCEIGYGSFSGCDQLILATADNPYAAAYAAENYIDTDFTESNSFMWLKIVGGTVLLLGAVLLAALLLKRKTKKNLCKPSCKDQEKGL